MAKKSKTGDKETGQGNRIKTALYLDRAQFSALKALQDAVGVPVSVSIRRAIDQYLQSLGQEKK